MLANWHTDDISTCRPLVIFAIIATVTSSLKTHLVKRLEYLSVALENIDLNVS